MAITFPFWVFPVCRRELGINEASVLHFCVEALELVPPTNTLDTVVAYLVSMATSNVANLLVWPSIIIADRSS